RPARRPRNEVAKPGGRGMRRIVMALALIGALTALPAASFAQQAPAPAMAQASGPSNGKLLAIGVGAVLGAAIVGTPVWMSTTTLLGAVAGGVLGAWWYNDHVAPPAVR